MNQYVTGAVIRTLREKNKMTQLQLAEKLGVSDKGNSADHILLLDKLISVSYSMTDVNQ